MPIIKCLIFSVDAKVVVSDGSPQDREGGDQLPSDIFNVYEANNNVQFKEGVSTIFFIASRFF